MKKEISLFFGEETPRISGDELADYIRNSLVSNAKWFESAFPVYFGSHDSLVEALGHIHSEPAAIVKQLKHSLADTKEEHVTLHASINELISRNFENRPPSKKVRYCRQELLLSYAYGAVCYLALGRGEMKHNLRAIGYLARLEFYCGAALAHADSLPWSGPFGSPGAFDSIAALGAFAKLAIDPKQKDKAMVRECWDEWQKEPERYKGKAAFARDMLDKFESLESQPVIEGWCRTWERKEMNQPPR